MVVSCPLVLTLGCPEGVGGAHPNTECIFLLKPFSLRCVYIKVPVCSLAVWVFFLSFFFFSHTKHQFYARVLIKHQMCDGCCSGCLWGTVCVPGTIVSGLLKHHLGARHGSQHQLHAQCFPKHFANTDSYELSLPLADGEAGYRGQVIAPVMSRRQCTLSVTLEVESLEGRLTSLDPREKSWWL